MALFPNELTPKTYRDMADTVLKWVQAYPQLCHSKQNRLIQQCKLYIKTKYVIQKTDPNWLTYIQGLKDIQEYWFIIEILDNQLLDAPFIEPFKLSLQDPNLPKDSKDSTPGRNTQFELFIAAVASRAGISVERLGDSGADWVLTATGKRWSIETKRIKSLDRMEEHIRKASKQIMASNIGGIIAIDISLAINQTCELSEYVHESEIEKAHNKRTNCFIEKYLPSIREWVGRRNVGFVLFHDYVIVPNGGATPAGNSPWGLIGLWQKADLFSPSASIKNHYDDLWSLFESALPNL